MNLHEWAGIDEYDPRATLAVVFTDIIDSTTLARTVGDKDMFDMLVSHFDAARAFQLLHGGYEIKLIGDAYMVAFRTADAALQFALDFRRDTGDPRIGIRVGIHVGQVRIKDDDIYGLMVNLAARLSHVKVVGEEGIFLSGSAKRDIEAEYGSNQKDLRFLPVQRTNLQGFDAREEVWQVITPEIRVARNARLKAKQEAEARKNPQPAAIRLSEPTRVPEVPQYKPPQRNYLLDALTRGPTRNKDKA